MRATRSRSRSCSEGEKSPTRKLGRKILDQVAEAVEHTGKVEVYPKLDGPRNMIMVLAPDKKAQAEAKKKAQTDAAEAAEAASAADGTAPAPAAAPAPAEAAAPAEVAAAPEAPIETTDAPAPDPVEAETEA
ncbi:hypothetical protein ACE2AJ_02175 [Aquihabitans daechungensis]|uniref:hypothetical protein n=1 Tax=Aquihabitans daechungensis TaxID=1052257 RepID=UPI003BA1381F